MTHAFMANAVADVALPRSRPAQSEAHAYATFGLSSCQRCRAQLSHASHRLCGVMRMLCLLRNPLRLEVRHARTQLMVSGGELVVSATTAEPTFPQSGTPC
jgi:hypothetical protein